MNFIALDIIDRNPLAKKRKIPSRSYDLRSQLAFMKCRLQTKKPQPIRTVKRRFRMMRIQYALAKHLVATAYTDDSRSLFVCLANLGGKSRFFEPTHVLRRILAAWQQNQVGRTENCRFMHIAESHIRLAFQTVEIRKVGNLRRTDDGEVEFLLFRPF